MILFSKMEGTGNDFIIINCISQYFSYSLNSFSKYLCNRKFGVRFLRLAPADQLSGFSLLYSVPQEAACLNSFTLGLASRNTDKIEDWEGKKLSMCSPVLWQEVAEFLHIRRCCCVAFLLWLSLLLQNFGVYLCSFFHFCLSLAS